MIISIAAIAADQYAFQHGTDKTSSGAIETVALCWIVSFKGISHVDTM